MKSQRHMRVALGALALAFAATVLSPMIASARGTPGGANGGTGTGGASTGGATGGATGGTAGGVGGTGTGAGAASTNGGGHDGQGDGDGRRPRHFPVVSYSPRSPGSCWSQRFYDEYGDLVIQRFCDRQWY